MIKMICFIKRKVGLSLEDFREHWLHSHGPLVASLPDFRRHIVRYEQNCRLDSDYERDEGSASEGFDGVTVQWFESRRDFYAFALEPSYKDTIFIDEGIIVEQGPSKSVLSAPRHDRTKRFLDRVLKTFHAVEDPG